MSVQYRGGDQYHGGWAVPWGVQCRGGYLEYHGVFSTMGDIMINVGDILSTMGDIMSSVGLS